MLKSNQNNLKNLSSLYPLIKPDTCSICNRLSVAAFPSLYSKAQTKKSRGISEMNRHPGIYIINLFDCITVVIILPVGAEVAQHQPCQ